MYKYNNLFRENFCVPFPGHDFSLLEYANYKVSSSYKDGIIINEVNLAGTKKQDIAVKTLKKGVLEVLIKEKHYCSIFYEAEDFSGEKATATYVDGILTVKIPQLKEPQTNIIID